ACYEVLTQIDQQLQHEEGLSPEDALSKAARIIGTFLTRVTEHVPENAPTLHDVAQGYLTVDAEYFGRRYAALWKAAFLQRELLTPETLAAWEAHRKAVPAVAAPADGDWASWLRTNLDALGIPAAFGARVEGIQQRPDGYRTLRIGLTLGREASARALAF